MVGIPNCGDIRSSMADGGWRDMGGYTRDTWYGRLCFADCVLHADGGMWFTSICRAGTDSDEEWTDVRCDERDRERESKQADKQSGQQTRVAGARNQGGWNAMCMYTHVCRQIYM